MDNGVDIAEDKIINANTTLSSTPSSREEGRWSNQGVEVDSRAEADVNIDNPSPTHQGNKNKQRVKLRAIPYLHLAEQVPS